MLNFMSLLVLFRVLLQTILKNFERLFDEKIDLLIVVGGGALGPQWYDRKHEETVQPYRDKMEEKLIHYCVNHGIPIIGTCRGMQYVNVLSAENWHII